MPFVNRIVTPKGEAEVNRLFRSMEHGDRRIQNTAFNHWLITMIAQINNKLVDTDQLSVVDVTVCEANRSTIMRTDLTLIISARWSKSRARASGAMRSEIKQAVLGLGFGGSVEVHLVLIGAPGHHLSPGQLVTKCELVNRALVHLAGGEQFLANAPIEIDVVGFSYQPQAQLLRKLGLIEIIKPGRGYDNRGAKPSRIRITRGQLTPDELVQLLAETQ